MTIGYTVLVYSGICIMQMAFYLGLGRLCRSLCAEVFADAIVDLLLFFLVFFALSLAYHTSGSWLTCVEYLI